MGHSDKGEETYYRQIVGDSYQLTVWYGMVWYGMYGMAWYDMVWHGMAWHSIVALSLPVHRHPLLIQFITI